MNAMNAVYASVAIVGLAAVTVLTRAVFMLSRRDPRLPDWLKRGLRYAPLAALAAVVVPEVLVSQGHLIDTWREPRLHAALAGAAWFGWRRGMLGTIVCGMAVFAALRFGLGW